MHETIDTETAGPDTVLSISGLQHIYIHNLLLLVFAIKLHLATLFHIL